VQKLLRYLLAYFETLFLLCDELNAVQAPAVINMLAMQERWQQQLSQAIMLLVPAYVGLLIAPTAVSKNNPRSPGTNLLQRHLTNAEFDNLYIVAELVVCLAYSKRSRNIIAKEITRLFTGPLGLSYFDDGEKSSLGSGRMKRAAKVGAPDARLSNILKQPSGLMSRTPPPLAMFLETSIRSD
ncbi:uncharacterized protein LOC108676841, partial [Hyalella azteca]|uniref:Uncharacterized protein LOC108676841 n=1 Tax=Hyalella azteca TaxID=294128 RepID=A0A8B7P2Z8_HYAAZ